MLPRRLYNIRLLPRCKGSGHLWLALPADIAAIAVHSTYGGFYITVHETVSAPWVGVVGTQQDLRQRVRLQCNLLHGTAMPESVPVTSEAMILEQKYPRSLAVLP